MAKDVAPALLKAIQEDFARRVRNDATIARITSRIKDNSAKLGEIHTYAQHLGEALSASLVGQLTEEALPDGRLYWNIASRTITPMLENNYRLTNEAARTVQKYIDEASGIGLNAVSGKLPAARIKGLVDQAVAQDTFEAMQTWLKEPVVNASEAFFDDFIKANAEFRGRSGLSPKIIRTVAGGCCDWCADVAGTYDYGSEPKDVYRRHQYCRCIVTFESGRQRQNVWSKEIWEDPPETLEARKSVGLPQGRGQDVTPEYFGTAAPGKGKVERQPDYDEKHHANEIKTAQWLHDTFGGDIELLSESAVEGQTTPDYLWRGRLWDLKNPSTAKAADSAIRHGIKQIRDNPGGLILDYGDHIVSIDAVRRAIETRMRRGFDSTMDIMVISQGKVKMIYRYVK